MALEGNSVYLTEGNPFVGEAIPRKIIEIAKENNVPYRIFFNSSSLEEMFIKTNLNPFEDGLVITKPADLENALKSNLPIFIVLIGYSLNIQEIPSFNKFLIKELLCIKKTLLNKFPKDYQIYLLNPNGIFVKELEDIEDFSKHWIRRQSSIYIPKVY
jgi:uncharacterized protein YabN with tetrapyrrole methylase and pyrophosphatase domain